MNLIEIYRQIRTGFLVAFIITAPALITAGFKVFEVPYIHFYDENGTISLNGIVIFAEPFYMFLVQKANVLLTYFPPSFIFGTYLAHLFKSKPKETILRGLKRVEPKQMAKVIKKLAIEQATLFRYESAYRLHLAGVPIPYAMEAQSFLFLGQAGCGKTQAMLNAMEQIKDYGETIIAYDRKPDYYTRYYREGKDYLFYPKDRRSINFNLLDQISEETAFEDISFIVSTIIPDSSGNDAHWNMSARSVLKATLITIFFSSDRSNKAMVKLLRDHQGAKRLKELVQSSPHAKRFGIDITATLSANNAGEMDGQGNSVFSTVDLYLEPLRNEVFVSDNEPFSIRDFVWANEHENQDTRLFLVQTTMEQDAYTIWYRTFLALLSREIRSLPNRLNRRIFIMADEFQSLGKFKEIVNDLPAEARSKGAVLMLATQSLSAIKEMYGNELMQSIMANTKTKVVFSLGDLLSQETMEKYFGKQEIEEQRFSYSEGVGLESNRVNMSTNTTTKPAVMGVELLSLKTFNAFIQMDEYVCKIEFSPVSVPDITSFQPKPKSRQINLDGLIVTSEFCDAAVKYLDNNSSEMAKKNAVLNENLAVDLADTSSNEAKVTLRKQYDIEREKINTPSVNSEYSFELI